MKILVAEDDMASGKFMMKLLAKYGEVVLARDGIAAVDEFVNAVNTNERFDLICMDVMMPKIDGYKALASIRDAERKLGLARDKRVKVVMVSALDEGFDANYASDDYEEYMCKPIDIMKFDNLIRKLEII